MTNEEITSRTESTEQSKRLIHVSFTEHGIVVFKFDKLTRTAFAEYLAYIRKYNGQYPDPLRMLYDFRNAGLPGLPFIEMHSEVMDGIQIPEHTRWAHLVDKQIYSQFVKTLNSRMPTAGYEHASFTDETEAINWLMRPFELDLI